MHWQIFIVLDCLKPITHKKLIEHELEGFGIRLNKKPPAITFRRKEKGGINFSTAVSNPKLDLDGATSTVWQWRRVLAQCFSCVAVMGEHGRRFKDACTCAPAAIKAVCAEYRCHNADINMREDCDLDDLVDVIEGSRCAPIRRLHANRMVLDYTPWC